MYLECKEVAYGCEMTGGIDSPCFAPKPLPTPSRWATVWTHLLKFGKDNEP